MTHRGYATFLGVEFLPESRFLGKDPDFLRFDFWGHLKKCNFMIYFRENSNSKFQFNL